MEVISATSFDSRFNPSNVMTSDTNQVWTTTGLYPQEVTISFTQAKVINEIKFKTTGARKVKVEGCQTATANAFKSIAESAELAKRANGLQEESLKVSQPAPYVMVKFIIQDGHDDFTTVH